MCLEEEDTYTVVLRDKSAASITLAVLNTAQEVAIAHSGEPKLARIAVRTNGKEECEYLVPRVRRSIERQFVDRARKFDGSIRYDSVEAYYSQEKTTWYVLVSFELSNSQEEVAS